MPHHTTCHWQFASARASRTACWCDIGRPKADIVTNTTANSPSGWSALNRSTFFEGEYDRPVLLNIHHCPLIQRCNVQRLVELSEVRLAIIGVFTFDVRVMNKAHETSTSSRRRPLQHLQIAVR